VTYTANTSAGLLTRRGLLGYGWRIWFITARI
jgi:hypothetical protein